MESDGFAHHHLAQNRAEHDGVIGCHEDSEGAVWCGADC